MIIELEILISFIVHPLREAVSLLILLNFTRELKVLNIFKMYFLLCNKDLTKQIRTHGLLLKCKKILDIKSKICGRSRYRRFLEVARAAL